MNPRSRIPALLLLATSVFVVLPAWAQQPPREVVLSPENVRYDYAQVLGVRPVYQVLRTTSSERVCDVNDEQKNPIARVVGVVKDKLGRDGTTEEERSAGLENCRMQTVPREYRRVIAYDVDYVYKGSKFRTRMGKDPGNRLRIRVSITPFPAN